MSRKIEETTKLAAKVEDSHDAVRYYDYKDQYRLIDCLAQKHPLAEKGYQVIQNQDNGAAVVIYGEDKTLGLVLRSEEKRFWTEKDKVNIGRKWITETDVEVLFLERQSIENTKT